jgi:hypothetical protein
VLDVGGRNPLWMAAVERRGGYDIDILRWFGNERDALRFERQMIEALRPECNIHGTAKTRARSVQGGYPE